MATLIISAANYGFSILALHLLTPQDFSRFAAGQAVLLILGNGAMAAIPWAVAKFIAITDRPSARAEAMAFGVRASAWQALCAAGAAEAVLFHVAGPAVAGVTALGAAGFSLAAGPVGYLQGVARVDRLARFRLWEGLVRVLSSVLLVLAVSTDPAVALLGFPIGAAVMLAMSFAASRDALPWKRPDRLTSRRLLHQSFHLGSVQILLVSLGAMDAVAAQAVGFTSRTVGSYQAASLLGRLPLFVSAALTIAVFTELSSADERGAALLVQRLMRYYAIFTIPVLVALFTVPHSLLSIVVPGNAATVASLLKYTVVSGAAIGVINCLSTAHQARGRIRAALVILTPVAIAQPLLLLALGNAYGIRAFSVGLVTVSVLAAVAFTWDSRGWLHWRRPADVRLTVLLAVACVAAWRLSDPALWLASMAAVTGCVVGLLVGARADTGVQSRNWERSTR